VSAADRARVAIGVLLAGGAVLGTVWLAGALFFMMGKVNPLGAVDLTTWWTYWQAWGEDPDMRRQLLVAAACATCIPLVFGLGAAIALKKTRAQHGDARFATLAEIKRAGLLGSNGVVVGKFGRRYLTYAGFESIGLVAPTGAGKGVSVVIPTLLSYDQNCVVLDIKGENFAITSRYRASRGQAVFVFNPFDPEGRTHRINVFDDLSKEPRVRVTQLMALAQARYPTVGSDIWNPTARNLFVAVAMYISETPGLPVTMGEVLRQGSGKGRPPRDHIEELLRSRNYTRRQVGVDRDGEPKYEYDPIVQWDGSGLPPLSSYCADAMNVFLGSKSNTSASIVTTFTAALSLWTSPMIDAATSASDFSLADLRRRKMDLYICIPANKLATAEPIVGPLLTELIDANTDTMPGSDERVRTGALLLLDEMAKLGYQPMIESAISFIRGYWMRILAVFQSTGQIMDSPPRGYGIHGAKALLDNLALKIMFTPQSQDDARAYSELLGTETVKSRSMQIRKWGEGSESEAARPLMLPQELRDMGDDEQILHLRGTKPIRCQKVRYYSDPEFVDRLKSVSPMLAALGKRLPNQAELDAAVIAGELSVQVRPINLDLHEAIVEQRVRVMTRDDVKDGVDLARVAVDLSSIPVLEGSVTSEADVDTIVASFWSQLDTAAGIDTTSEEPSSDGETDLETGEWAPAPALDLALLKPARSKAERA